MLRPTAAIVSAAVEGGHGVGAFNVIQLEHASAIVAGAEQAGTAVLLQISENCVRYHRSLAPLLEAALAVAAESSVPVAVHLDHIESASLVRTGAAHRIGSVMFDASTEPYGENVATTREIAEFCHARGIWVEAELGEVGGKDGVHAPGVRTDPGEAREFVAATGVDALAVAVGSSHAMTTRDARLDFDLIAALKSTVDVPLVLHGSSGVSDEDLTRAVRSGITKVNISTHLNKVFTDEVRNQLDDGNLVDTRKYLGPARDRMADEVARLLGVLDAVPAGSVR
ncbi:fructose-bisphosphate aldolase class II [Saccharothrix tamanrassetensis]|uniref:Fructose-bisphosphate aldolase class II n=1 Tax=Saccharothrix tamanrassetensis TaxID=1051531 RepID=A0A841CR28_9PSEU|nr:class II fructose-bisphosphate aldolase [Saccharothrix tamanrassetensis]MBB5960181.1 fructose-bisphosphate aldolase class II [Saccharothrix tamanrassetensis]